MPLPWARPGHSVPGMPASLHGARRGRPDGRGRVMQCNATQLRCWPRCRIAWTTSRATTRVGAPAGPQTPVPNGAGGPAPLRDARQWWETLPHAKTPIGGRVAAHEQGEEVNPDGTIPPVDWDMAMALALGMTGEQAELWARPSRTGSNGQMPATGEDPSPHQQSTESGTTAPVPASQIASNDSGAGAAGTACGISALFA
jgi:hypothetical protein